MVCRSEHCSIPLDSSLCLVSGMTLVCRLRRNYVLQASRTALSWLTTWSSPLVGGMFRTSHNNAVAVLVIRHSISSSLNWLPVVGGDVVCPEADLFASDTTSVLLSPKSPSLLCRRFDLFSSTPRWHRLYRLCHAGDGRGRFLGSLHSLRLLSDVGRD